MAVTQNMALPQMEKGEEEEEVGEDCLVQTTSEGISGHFLSPESKRQKLLDRSPVVFS